jgi:alpha-ketoglutarate-dependent taurine dioxygenase
MSCVTIKKISDRVGAEICGVDEDRLLHDTELPGFILHALDNDFARLRVLHSIYASQRHRLVNPTAEQEAYLKSRPQRKHPLVWKHRNGRCSLVLGASADYVVGTDIDEGRALLQELLDRATRPEQVYHHDWSVGDLLVWDNRGLLHRACPYAETSPRELHRTTILGDEPIR